ncbi:MAG: class I SAM-dependent methyltransferase [Paludibacteraceae bacterium]|nr:class I SAM-dependent methyltransferase [Paludibacteraceae bacterium]MBR3872456.1 class I SAM-dependent methyltransferase [Paludibacteraceae bacterium]
MRELEKYILEHSEEESKLLQDLTHEANVKLLHPHMLSGHIQGRLLSMLVAMIKPQRVLELGTYVGYSAICLAENLPEDGKLITIDIDDEIEDMARKYIGASPNASKIEFIVADALQWLSKCDETFDLIFIDANKRHYIEYYNAVFDKLKPGGFILADNTLWGGKVVEKVASNDYQTKGLLAFNDYLNSEKERISYFILPLRDGLTFIQKK